MTIVKKLTHDSKIPPSIYALPSLFILLNLVRFLISPLRCLASGSWKHLLLFPPLPKTSVLFLITILLHPADAAFRTRVLPTHSAMYNLTTKNSGGYCELDPRCTCVNNVNQSYVHCKGLVDIVMQHCHGFHCVSMTCAHNISSDPYKYLSMLETDLDDYLTIEFTVTNCPLPGRSYASYFYSKDQARKNSSASPLDIEEMFIDCGMIQNFPLKRHHLNGLNSLLSLMINCTALRTIPNDLLHGIPQSLCVLSFFNTSLETVPVNMISIFPELNLLEMRMGRLKSLHKDIFRGAHALSSLILGSNAIEHLDDDIFLQTPEMDHFQISQNRLTRLPRSMGTLKKLRELIAMDNLIDYIEPECFVGLESLKILNIANNKIQTLDSRLFSGMKNIVTLYLSNLIIGSTSSTTGLATTNQSNNNFSFTIKSNEENNTIETLPQDLFSKNLLMNKIVVKNTPLTTLPSKIFFFNAYLTVVDFSSNKITDLPFNLFENNLIKILNLSNNSISCLAPNFLANQTFLEYMNLSRNRITTLNKLFLDGVPKLKYLDLSNNLIEELPEEIFLPFNMSTHLKSLNLAENMLQYLPSMTLPSVTNLNLAKNRLFALSQTSHSDVRNLKYLNISYNLFHLIPTLAFNIKEFTSLDFSHNRISSSIALIETDISVMPRVLNFSGNNVNQLELRISHSERNDISRIEHLDFSNNKMSSFAVVINKYALDRTRHKFSLKRLNLSRNKLNFSESVMYFDHTLKIWGYRSQLCNFTSLEVLLLSHNEIVMIPADWRHALPNLRLLDLRHNKIKYLGHEDLLFTNGILPEDIKTFGFSERYYIKNKDRDPYYRFSDWHKLTVDLRHNLIEALEFQNNLMMNVPRDCFVEQNFGHATIHLGNNPFVCGCQVFPLLKYANKEIRPVAEKEMEENNKFVLPAIINIDGLTCQEPLSVHGKNVSDPETWSHHLLPLLGMCLTNHNLANEWTVLSERMMDDVTSSFF